MRWRTFCERAPIEQEKSDSVGNDLVILDGDDEMDSLGDSTCNDDLSKNTRMPHLLCSM